MRAGAFHTRRWISLGLLLIMALSFALPTFALPNVWYKNIYVTKNPSKMTYEIGESFDPAGMKLSGDVYDSNGKYKNSYSLPFTNDELKVSPSTFTKAGKQKVTVGLYCMSKSGSYDWLYTSLTVTVNESGDPPVEYYTDIFVNAQPKKTIYKVGESFKTSGLSINGHVYNALDGKKHTVTKLSLKNMKISPSKFTKAGKQNVKLNLYLLGKNGEHKWFSTTVQVLVEKGSVKITKHPTGEAVLEGGSCGFIARADYDDSRHWYLTKNGVVVDASDASAYFPGLTITGATKEHLKLSHIPVSLDGWSAYCIFYGEDSSATSNNAHISVLGKDPTPVPVIETPVPAAPKVIETTPQPTEEPEITAAPPVTEPPATEEPEPTEEPAATEAPAAPQTPAATRTPKPTKAPTPTPEPEYAQGIHCTINGESQVVVDGDTLLECEAEDIDGFVFDHWEINGEHDYSYGPSASFIASGSCVIRAWYRERKIVRGVNCFFQLLTKNDNASGTKYTEFDFEDAYYSPVTKKTCEGGTIDFYVTAVIPRKAEVDYWLINGVKYQFSDNNITKFRVVGLDEATTIEVVFRGTSPSYGKSHSSKYAELVYQEPRVARCINCWAQFMNANGTPSGKEYLEIDFENNYTNPVTRKKLPGGKLDLYLATKPPKNSTVESWIVNGVKYQFPQSVLKFKVFNLDEATTYEVRYKGVHYANPDPTPAAKYPGRNPGSWGWN